MQLLRDLDMERIPAQLIGVLTEAAPRQSWNGSVTVEVRDYRASTMQNQYNAEPLPTHLNVPARPLVPPPPLRRLLLLLLLSSASGLSAGFMLTCLHLFDDDVIAFRPIIWTLTHPESGKR